MPWGDPAILNEILRRGNVSFRNPRMRRLFEAAAVQTGLVESGGRNLPGGDADSQGWRQERSSLYPNPRNVRASVHRFAREFKQQYDRGEHSWDVAAQVQRPAAQYRGRYQDAASEAQRILAKAGVQAGGAQPSLSGPSWVPGASNLPQGSTGTLALLQALQGAQGGPQGVSGGAALQAPAFSAAPPLPQGAQATVSGGGPQPKQDIGALLQAVQQMGAGDVPAAAGQTGGGGGGQQAGGPVRSGDVTISPGADRAGVSTRPHVVHFLERVAGIAGEGITVGTGTHHSQMTVNGNESDHWTGRAADVPATGRDLIHLGRSALIAAGMSRAEARKQTGGLFNLMWHGRRVQVIFNTHEGGDHTNHLHVGLSAPR